MSILSLSSLVVPSVFAWPTVYPRGTTIYNPEKCYNGYTIFANGYEVKLIDMNGRVVNEWKVDFSRTKGDAKRAKLLKNGNMVVLRGKMTSQMGGIQEYDWDNKLVWEYIPSEHIDPSSNYPHPHHDFQRLDNGNTLIICREKVPEEYMKKVTDPERRNITIYPDVILEITPDKEIAWEWHQYKYLDINRCNPIPALREWWCKKPDTNTISDWTHTNTVQALPENKWYHQGDDRFAPGNVLMCMRQLDIILIADKNTKEVVWSYSGDYKGGLSGPHEPHMIEKGTPGEGNILIFDNGATPCKDLAHAGCSFVLEVNPVTKEVVWIYEDGEHFHSNFTSNSQRLRNGSTLICESTGARFFEVTTEGEIVWEYVEGSPRAYRYPYDYCPQTSALGKPKESPVTPPKEMRISPDVPLE